MTDKQTFFASIGSRLGGKKIPFVALRWPIAGLFLFSAGMKAWQTGMEPAVVFPWFSIFSVEYEFLLALALLLGILPKWTRLLTLLTFVVFFTVTIRLIAQSADSCGCFGKLHVAPEITAVLDFSFIVLLLFSRAAAGHGLTRRRSGLFLLGMALTIIPAVWMGRPHPPIYAEHTTEDRIPQQTDFRVNNLGYIEPESYHRCVFKLANTTAVPWNILKTETGCQCLTVLDAPSVVEPGAVGDFLFSFAAGSERQAYYQRITIHTDHAEEPKKILTLQARIGIPLAIEPDRVTIPNSEEWPHSVPLTFYNDSVSPVGLLYATSSNPTVVLKVPLEPVPAHSRQELSLVVQSPRKADQNGPITIMLHTDDPEQPSLTVLVDWEEPSP